MTFSIQTRPGPTISGTRLSITKFHAWTTSSTIRANWRDRNCLRCPPPGGNPDAFSSLLLSIRDDRHMNTVYGYIQRGRFQLFFATSHAVHCVRCLQIQRTQHIKRLWISITEQSLFWTVQRRTEKHAERSSFTARQGSQTLVIDDQALLVF